MPLYLGRSVSVTIARCLQRSNLVDHLGTSLATRINLNVPTTFDRGRTYDGVPMNAVVALRSEPDDPR